MSGAIEGGALIGSSGRAGSGSAAGIFNTLGAGSMKRGSDPVVVAALARVPGLWRDEDAGTLSIFADGAVMVSGIEKVTGS